MKLLTLLAIFNASNVFGLLAGSVSSECVSKHDFESVIIKLHNQLGELNDRLFIFKQTLKKQRLENAELNAEITKLKSGNDVLNVEPISEIPVHYRLNNGKLSQIDSIIESETDNHLQKIVKKSKETLRNCSLDVMNDDGQREGKYITKQCETSVAQQKSKDHAPPSRVLRVGLNSRLGRQLIEKNEHIAFSVFVKNDITSLSKGDIIKFDGFMLNDGSGYDVNTGMFTAPRGGLYLFSFVVEDYHDQDLWVALYQDNLVRSLAVAEPFQSNQNVMGGNVVLLHVGEGSKIWIAISKGNRIQNGWSTFSGVLLH